jgi:hypothetical protein
MKFIHKIFIRLLDYRSEIFIGAILTIIFGVVLLYVGKGYKTNPDIICVSEKCEIELMPFPQGDGTITMIPMNSCRCLVWQQLNRPDAD